VAWARNIFNDPANAEHVQRIREHGVNSNAAQNNTGVRADANDLPMGNLEVEEEKDNNR